MRLQGVFTFGKIDNINVTMCYTTRISIVPNFLPAYTMSENCPQFQNVYRFLAVNAYHGYNLVL